SFTFYINNHYREVLRPLFQKEKETGGLVYGPISDYQYLQVLGLKYFSQVEGSISDCNNSGSCLETDLQQ
ncbi:hypothetical protein TNCT_223681, partial [Trichonephila clavata]